MNQAAISKFVDNLDVTSRAYRILVVVAALLIVISFFVESQIARNTDTKKTEVLTVKEMQTYLHEIADYDAE